MRYVIVFILLLLASPAWCAEYYARADGTAGNITAATSCDSASTAMNRSRFNNVSFQSGDTIYFCDDGGTYNGAFVLKSGGTHDGITLKAAAGDSPLLLNATDITGWTSYGSNIWYAANDFTTGNVYYGEISTVEKRGSIVEVDDPYEWYNDTAGDLLYIYHVDAPSNIMASVRYGNSFDIRSDDVTISGLEMTKSNEAAVRQREGDGLIVEDCEIYNTGYGISMRGANVIARRNEIHDLNMIYNTDDGAPAINDYGVIAFLMPTDGHQIYDNKIYNLIKHSYDYGMDGAVFEFYYNGTAGYTFSDYQIYRNYIENVNGVWELSGVGGTGPYYLSDIVMQGNVIIDFNTLGYNHIEEVVLTDFYFYNNSVQTSLIDETHNHTFVLGWTPYETPTSDEMYMINNVFDITNEYDTFTNNDGFTHEYNNYNVFPGDMTLGYDDEELGRGEFHADPLLEANLEPTEDSPAILAGTDLGEDYDTFLLTGTSWTDGILTVDADTCGWSIGAYGVVGASSVKFDQTGQVNYTETGTLNFDQ